MPSGASIATTAQCDFQLLVQALDRWENRLEALFEGRPYDALDAALTDTVARFPVHIQPFRHAGCDLFLHRLVALQACLLAWRAQPLPLVPDLASSAHTAAGT